MYLKQFIQAWLGRIGNYLRLHVRNISKASYSAAAYWLSSHGYENVCILPGFLFRSFFTGSSTKNFCLPSGKEMNILGVHIVT